MLWLDHGAPRVAFLHSFILLVFPYLGLVIGGRKGEWLEPASVALDLEARRISVEIPMGFTDMLSQAPELALEWRMTTREIFTTYFARGYRAMEFFLDRAGRKGTYLLVKDGR